MKFFKKLSTLLLVLGICIGAVVLTSCGAIFDMLGISFGDNDDAYEDNYHENDNFGNNYDENGTSSSVTGLKPLMPFLSRGLGM